MTRFVRSSRLLGCLLWAAFSGLAMAQDAGISPQHHPWARFQPGAWKLVRVVTETLDEKGAVASTSTTDTRTILVSVDKDGVTLEVQSTIEVAGKRFEAEPQVLRQGLYGESCTQELRIKPATNGQVVIDGQKISCRVQQLECAGAANSTITNVYYSDTVAPYMLRREATTTDPQGKSLLSETTVEIAALDMPGRVLGEIKSTALVKTIDKHPKGAVTTWAVTSPEVPGGVISHMSKETDASGRLVRRSTLELVSCGKECDEDTLRVFGRKRRNRVREVPSPYPPR
jgi:hypothetical protein